MKSLLPPAIASRVLSVIGLGTLASTGGLFAHPGHAHHPNSLIDGLIHPLTGLDHFVVMVAVGLWALQMGGAAVWVLPLAFVVFMMGGAGLGLAGVHLPMVEPMILASVLLCGVLLAMAYRPAVLVAAVLVGIMAVFHGAAHAFEMPFGSQAGAYLLGFSLSTFLLLGFGILLGLGLVAANARQGFRWTGGAVALLGVGLFVTAAWT